MNEDVVHELQPQAHKDKGLKVHGSNLCAEIMLPTSKERTAVCCLSSLNLEKYEEWEDTYIVSDLVKFLDNVLQYFIDTAPIKDYGKAIYSAIQERSIGIGAMGFHAFLQQKGIPFESALAVSKNRAIFSKIKYHAERASERLGAERGVPNDIKDTSDTERRNVHLLAIAPNASSSIILNTSPSIEPWKANAFLQKTASGSFVVRNKYLQEVLEKYYPDEVEECWTSILSNNGSVQHLDYLPEWEKDVFKTAIEINQSWVVQHAVDRQPHVCQSQSVNLFFPPEVEWYYLHKVHWKAMTELKSLYYLRTEATSRAENVSKQITRNVIETESTDCLACEG
jgi:ribonucleoside-diphosphate reductase alpha chain